VNDNPNEEWSNLELAALIRGVFKNGENEWSDLIDDTHFK
jgi:hypothetical protein